ncbi:MAG TPA: glycoside hydrolase family 97 N-terminal domain-containing protein, partial [Gemmatimonadaceae bacterium]|nr:glycoside hydrolase family 97 N-terminal domain-containing protein [Gemmatimonadaceae bacterium]
MKMYLPHWTRGMAFAALLATFAASTVIAQDTISVSSPDGRNKVGVSTNQGRLYYILSRDGRPIITPSMLGFEFRGAPTLRDSLRITGQARAS